jgi:hypothetical protein
LMAVDQSHISKSDQGVLQWKQERFGRITCAPRGRL